MKFKINSAFMILIVLSTSCSIFQKDSFEGKWQLNFTGGINETFDFVITPQNDFSFTKAVEYQGQLYDVTIKGTVSAEGILKADLIAMGQVLGFVAGNLTYENGTGKWDASYVNGNWTAVKK